MPFHPNRKQYREAQRKEANGTNGPVKMPQKRFYRQRAHVNIFSDHYLDYPISPDHMDWSIHFPAFVDKDPSRKTLVGTPKLVKDVEVVDIGCGFGGLLVALAPLLPDTLMVGMEIRVQVLGFLRDKIMALRSQQAQLRGESTPSTAATATATIPETPDIPLEMAASPASPSPSTSSTSQQAPPPTIVPGSYQNISAIRANTMKFLPNFFARHQLSKIFICFPDPHFKQRKHKARIVSASLNAEYAYVLRPGGLLYTITDVEEYHRWILRHFGVKDPIPRYGDSSGMDYGNTVSETANAQEDEQGQEQDEEGHNEDGVHRIREMWERVTDEELERDECVRLMRDETEEGKKVARNQGQKFVAVFRRKPDPEWP